MKNDGRYRTDGITVSEINKIITDAQGDREIRPASPEGAFRFIEQLRKRWIRYRIDAGLPQNLPWQARAIQIEEGTDLMSVGFAAGAIADDQKLIRKIMMNRWFMGSGGYGGFVIGSRIRTRFR